MSVSIEGVELDYCCELQQYSPLLASDHFSHQAVFHYFLSDSIKQDSATTAAQIKHIVKLLHNRRIRFVGLSTISENTDVCLEQYRCATVLYLLSILAYAYNKNNCLLCLITRT